MPRFRAVLYVVLVLSLVAPASVAVAQSDGETVTLTVAVRDQAGNPIPDAGLNVTWDGGSTTATTAANGKAFVDVPAGAAVTIEVTHPRYVRSSPYRIADAAEREVTVDVFRKSSVRLEVSDDDGPVANASVLIERGGLDVERGTTGPNGVFESGVLQAGSYSITISKAGYYTQRKPLDIDGDITNRVALRRGSTTVDVRVIDPHFDPARPVAGANVTLVGIGGNRTDRGGSATITVPVNTETTLRVTRDGYRTVERDLQIGGTATTVSIDISRTPSITLAAANERVVAGGRVVLTATDAYGDPAANATIYLDGERTGTTDGEGEAAVRIEDPGDHTLYVARNGVRSNEVSVEAISADNGAATPMATSTATPSPTATTGTGPGFGAALAVLAILLLAARFVRR
ncbi:MAG: carboxypeptidase regulatory-like domain-containing protein [Haloplanus sp.]